MRLASAPGPPAFQCCFSACNIEKLEAAGDEAIVRSMNKNI